MFCHNCGNRLDGKAVVCLKCGVLVSRSEYKKENISKRFNVQGLISLFFAIISILMCFGFMLTNISYVSMYTRFIERLYCALELVFPTFLLSFITLIISSVGRNRDIALNKCALFLSIVSLIFVITEIVIVIIY